jgi:hypothetical protein
VKPRMASSREGRPTIGTQNHTVVKASVSATARRAGSLRSPDSLKLRVLFRFVFGSLAVFRLLLLGSVLCFLA